MKSSRARKIVLAIVGLAALFALGAYGALEYYFRSSQDPSYFDPEIAAFVGADRRSPPAEGTIVFVGSSSIRFWDTLERDMGGLPVLNRGFGGSQLTHLIRSAHLIVTPCKPRAVLVYSGDNDLDERTGKTAEVVLRDYQRLVTLIHEEVPTARIYFLAIKPSKLRWARWPEMSRANRLVKEWSAADPRLAYIDTASALLGPDGQPRDDVYRFDGLHLNEVGYAEWTRLIRPVLERDLQPPE
jgi:lysophospholipase L1-like esterase